MIVPSPAPRDNRFRAFRITARIVLSAVALFLAMLPQSCSIFGDAEPEPDTVSGTRSQLIAAAGGFICLYREGANPADLLYVKDTANAAGFQVIFKIAESAVIPEAIRKGWGDVAVGFTEAEAKKLKLGLRIVPLPRREDDEFREDAGTNIILLRSADDYLDGLLNPEKQFADSQMPGL